MKPSHYLTIAACAAALALPGPLFAKDKGQDQGGDKDKKPELTAKQVMKHFDKDENGKLEGTELDELRNAFGGKMHDRMKSFDKNNNGLLDDDEIAAIVAAAQEKGHGKKNK